MEILKLIAIFAVIILVMWLKKPLYIGIIAAIITSCLLFMLPFQAIGQSVYTGLLGWGSIQLVLVLYSITFLQRMMEKRNALSNAKDALDGIFNNRWIDSSIAPMLIGMLPAVGTVLICGDLVRKTTDGHLNREEQACVTSYYRHVSELFFPTYASILIAINLSNGKVSVGSFTLAMIPMMIALLIIGWLVYLRKIPKKSDFESSQSKRFYAFLFIKSIWPIVFTVVLIVAFKLPVYLSVILCVIVNFFVSRFKVQEVLPFFKSAFEPKLIVNTVLIMVFKEILSATGVINALPELFSQLPIPQHVIFALIFFFGSIVSGSQAMIVMCMPMAMETVTTNGLSLFVLLMCMTYAAMQISPVHVCLTVCAEDYNVSLGALIKRTIPLLVLFVCVAFAYYYLLGMAGM